MLLPKMTNKKVFVAAACMGISVVCPLSLHAQSGDKESQPYAKVCLSVVTDAPSAKKEEVFKAESLPGPGKALVVHAVTSKPCDLLVAAFNRENEELSYGWRPEFVELTEEWDEVQVPKSGGKWAWEAGSNAFDVYVLFLSAPSTKLREIKQLVTAMQNTNDAVVFAMQTDRLRALISGICGDTDPSKHVAVAKTTEVAGAMRSSSPEFNWRTFSSRVSFNDGSPGLLIYRRAGTKAPTASPPPAE
jgi:hypothetical protein